MTAPAVAYDQRVAELAEEEPPAARNRFHLLGIAEVEQLPDPTYLVAGVLPERAAVMLYGAPGDGKTFLALDLALSIATRQEKWFGHAVKPGRVVYIASEGLGGLKHRLQAWAFAHPDAPDGPIQFVGEAVQLLQLEDTIQLSEAIVAYSRERPALIVLDTLSRCTPGGDENAVQDTSLAIQSVDYLRRRFEATVLLTHHTAKGSDLERGSGNWRGAMDLMLHVRNDDTVRELRSTKVRDGAPLDGLRFVLKPVLQSCVVAGPDETDDDRLTQNQRAALETLERLSVGGDPVTATVWLKASGLHDRTFYYTAAKLQSLMLIRKNAQRYALTADGKQKVQLQIDCKGTANTL